ncbi:hypothetical protein V5O48_018881 [Marasmius crinis-equi]|uniref:Uncharacterized protein n=1 Tax=Marasmius crinis-equi TaxID=585013 RepID=A0ABR3EJY6_9AGAR
MVDTKATRKRKDKAITSDFNNSKPTKKPSAKCRKIEPEKLSDDKGEADELCEGEGKSKDTSSKKVKSMRINWDVSLQEAIVTAIEDKKLIKQKLYLPLGANPSTADGRGNKKMVAHWQICEEVFTNHAIYKEDFQAALDANPSTSAGKKIRDSWSGGVKAQLQRMEIKTNEIQKAMGQTGMGLKSADDIDMSLDSSITNAWQLYGEKYPWFFRFRDIIREQPNLVLTGIGNSSTPIELEVEDFDLTAPATSDYDADLAEDDKNSKPRDAKNELDEDSASR